MRAWACLLAALAFASTPRPAAASCNRTLSKQAVADLVNRLQARIYQVTTNDTDGNRYYPLVPGLIRLAFHACAAARCGSYVDLSNPGNNGLQPVVSIIDRFWDSLQGEVAFGGLSKADLYALAGVAAVEVATGFKRSVVYRYGRHGDSEELDAAAAPPPSVELPLRSFGTQDTLDYFARVFGFGDAETVAIFGAHSLGVVHDFGTGQPLAKWVDGRPDVLSNEFYVRLFRSDWQQTGRRYNQVPYQLQEWQLPSVENRLMLNPDIGLVKEVDVRDPVTGAAVETAYVALRSSRTAAIARAFASNSSLFLDKFAEAFGKLIEHGWTGQLHEVVP